MTRQPHLQDVPTAAGPSAPCEHTGAEQSVWSNQSCQVPEEGVIKRVVNPLTRPWALGSVLTALQLLQLFGQPCCSFFLEIWMLKQALGPS